MPCTSLLRWSNIDSLIAKIQDWTYALWTLYGHVLLGIKKFKCQAPPHTAFTPERGEEEEREGKAPGEGNLFLISCGKSYICGNLIYKFVLTLQCVWDFMVNVLVNSWYLLYLGLKNTEFRWYLIKLPQWLPYQPFFLSWFSEFLCRKSW